MKRLLFSVSIRDCRVDAIASTPGAGGQHKNRRHTAIRVTHPPSKAVGYSADERSQLQNKTAAFRRMTETKEFKNWQRLEVARHLGKPSIDEIVDASITPSNLRIECVDSNGRWTPMKEETT